MDPVQALERNRHLQRLVYLDPVTPVAKQSKKVPKDEQDVDLFDSLLETRNLKKNKLVQVTTSSVGFSTCKNANSRSFAESRKQGEDVVIPIALSSHSVEQSLLKVFLKDKVVCSYQNLHNYLENQKTVDSQWSDDFVLFGCIWDKTSVREGKHGFKFAVCKLCDMQGNSASLLTMLLTRQACDSFWKENPGTVLMIISPKVLKPRSHGDGCAIQVDKANQIWILGKAEHYGFCPAVRKDGTVCGVCIDTRFGTRCAYHENLNIRSKTSTKRPELNSVPTASAIHPRKHMKPARYQNLSKGAFNVSLGNKKACVLLNNLEGSRDSHPGQAQVKKVLQSSAIQQGRHSHGMRYLNNLKEKTSFQGNVASCVEEALPEKVEQHEEQSIELTDDEE
ncbi:hypothetical protein GAYE_PCTG60G1369 [Galdieria yellowstonensis]|uniref:Zinc finger Mcm10/DnaG-type domain-containing protein n=1 Tax=Galdieria yellowstonensis TaxID=3028027 RepID=A0AAV9I3Z0_9RHOD|nr:hypothetical protein GAYE_PCTG60G1369 [Galdieria yellowstonensis]